VAPTPKEFDVLALLLRNPGRVLTHRDLLKTVWGPAHIEDAHYLRIVIARLREKLGHNAANPTLIFNEPGIGYRAASEQCVAGDENRDVLLRMPMSSCLCNASHQSARMQRFRRRPKGMLPGRVSRSPRQG